MMGSEMEMIPGWLVLSDGAAFKGRFVRRGGASRDVTTTGEVVFNTALTGYQEVLTDPSYAGQIVTFTYPHLGNYGANRADGESRAIFCRGVIAREYTERPSNWRSEGSLYDLLERFDVPLLVDVDTRRLTRHIRNYGSLPAVMGTGPLDDLTDLARSAEGTDGRDLASEVSRLRIEHRAMPGGRRVVAFDFGIKESILRQLARRFDLYVVPAHTSADEVLSIEPDGIFLSNGPGDPEAVTHAIATISELFGRVPIFGICLGHQLMALSQGGSTHKLEFGHHGSNHPIGEVSSGKVEITSQNHNYAVEGASLPLMKVPAIVSHLNLNDGVVEGIEYPRSRAFSVQYHPEAGPGPHDSYYLFDRFEAMIEREASNASS